MKMTKRIMSILLACAMLMCVMPLAVAADGTQEEPINANDKWFGFGVDCYLLNTTLEAGDTDGVWYRLTAETAGILQLEHNTDPAASELTPEESEDGEEVPEIVSYYVEYQVNAWVNGKEYKGFENGVYNKPIATYPVAIGDVIDIQVIAQNTNDSGKVYLNAKIMSGSNDINEMIKVKSTPAKLYVAAGATIFYQDDTRNAAFAAKYVTLSGDSVQGVTLSNVVTNANTGAVSIQKNFTDTDGDNVIESLMGGAEGTAGSPAVQPAWAIKNNSGEDRCFILSVVDEAHECAGKYACSNTCKVCGEPVAAGDHQYAYACSEACSLCGTERADVTHTPVGDYDCNKSCSVCYKDLSTADHQYTMVLDKDCDNCGSVRDVVYPLTLAGESVSEDKNGVAVRYSVQIDGMAADGFNAIYDNATIGDMKLVSMGAVVSNNYTEGAALPKLEDADGNRVLNISAQYVLSLDAETNTATYAIRVVDIPDEHKDTQLMYVPYLVLEDAEGTQTVVYVIESAITVSYNQAATPAE